MSLTNIIKIILEKGSPYKCTSVCFHFRKETSICTCQKGSYTIEAAIVVPLTAIFLTGILFFFRILQVQAVIEEGILYTGREVAAASSVVEEETALLVLSEGLLLSSLEEYPIVEAYVSGGNIGVSLLRSDFSGEEIRIYADYYIKLPLSIFGIKGIWMSSHNVFRKWDGENNEGIAEEEGWVYVTETGKVYHAHTGCRVLDLSVQSISVNEIEQERGRNGQKYYACTKCIKDITLCNLVYYTDYGTLFHQNISCSALKRTITKISIEDVGNRRQCSYCY